MSELGYLALFVPLVALYLLSIAVIVVRFRPPRPDRMPARRGRPRPGGEPLRLWIEDTERPQLASTRFLARFGLDARALRDIRVYDRVGELESFPARLIALLFDLYGRGAVRGVEAMALLFHGRPLRQGEALYFALIDQSPEPGVIAFIDRGPGG